MLAKFDGRARVGRYVTGGSFIALGLFVAWAGNRAAK
jgi:hypothetical protein